MTSVTGLPVTVPAGFARFFDIVNGFLIDAVAHCVCGDEPHVCTIAFTYRCKIY